MTKITKKDLEYLQHVIDTNDFGSNGVAKMNLKIATILYEMQNREKK